MKQKIKVCVYWDPCPNKRVLNMGGFLSNFYLQDKMRMKTT